MRTVVTLGNLQLFKFLLSHSHNYAINQFITFNYILTARTCSVKQMAGNTEINARTVVFTFSADDAAAIFRCKLDKSKFEVCKLVY